MDTKTRIADLTVGQLTRMVRCEHPGTTTEGAMFLINIRDTVVERLEFIAKPQGVAVGELELSFDDYHSIINDIRESAPSVYTETILQQVIDLGVWGKEYSIVDVSGMSISEHAEKVLRIIAQRLAIRLVEMSVAKVA
jgi:hypothetical protein